MNAFCSTCGKPLAPETHFCGSCGTGATAPPQLGGDPKTFAVNGTKKSLLIAGYVCGLVALFFLPPAFGLAGLAIGIVNLAKGKVGHGVAQIVIAVTCGVAGAYIGAVGFTNALHSLPGFQEGFDKNFQKSCMDAAMKNRSIPLATAETYCRCTLLKLKETNSQEEAVAACTSVATGAKSGADNESSQASQGLPEPTTQQSEPPATAASEGSETYYGHGSYESCMSAGIWMEMAMCSSDEYQREDVRLNREYKRVIATYQTLQREDSIAALRTEEVGWLKTMTSKCGNFEYDEPHGYKKAISENDCRLEMTKKRTDELAKVP